MAVDAGVRALIIESVRNTWKDPYSIRDAEISRAVRPQGYAGSRVAVCVRANAKNSFGAYTGRKVACFAIENGAVVATMGELPAGAAGPGENALLDWRPFREMERI